MLNNCQICGLWASVDDHGCSYCLHCAYVRLRSRMESKRFIPVDMAPPTPPQRHVDTHFRKGLPTPVVVDEGKTWPELLAERL